MANGILHNKRCFTVTHFPFKASDMHKSKSKRQQKHFLVPYITSYFGKRQRKDEMQVVFLGYRSVICGPFSASTRLVGPQEESLESKIPAQFICKSSLSCSVRSQKFSFGITGKRKLAGNQQTQDHLKMATEPVCVCVCV